MWAFMLALSILPPAYAIDTERHREGDWVVVSAAMRHSPERVKGVLSMHGQTMKLGSGVRAGETRPMADGGAHLTVMKRGLARDLTYTAERCPVADGWHSKMIQSSDFVDHQIIWTTVAEGEGSRTTIRVRVKLKVLVPEFLVQQIVGSALEQTLGRIDSLLDAR